MLSWSRLLVRPAASRVEHARRQLHASARHNVQRLLWAGSVLDQSSSSLREVPKDWLLAMGVQADVEQGISFTALAASHSHTLLAYKTLPPTELSEQPKLADIEQDGDADEEVPLRSSPVGLHKVASIGRNTHGELGLGFSSQESTWGMVKAPKDRAGAGGIDAIGCGLGSSWIATTESDDAASLSQLFSFGNHTSGQLGLGGDTMPYALSVGGQPQLQLYSSPKAVSTWAAEPATLQAIASGLDHTVLLVRNFDGTQSVRTCGNNTDGQLGHPSVRISSTSFKTIPSHSFSPPHPPSENDPIVGVAAGGDTSAVWTSSGRMWAWGNSEYGQALVGSKAIDRIDVPTEVPAGLTEARLKDVRFGGSFVVLLDDAGNVYTAGYGALGLGKDALLSHEPQRILQNATSISTGLEQASAVVDSTQLMVWGLDSAAGRLGLGRRKPYPSYMLASRFTPSDVELRTFGPLHAQGMRTEWGHIVDVVHGREAMFVLLEDGVEEVGRWFPPKRDA